MKDGYLALYVTWTSLVAQTIKCLPTMQETQVQSLGQKIPWRRKWQPTPIFLSEESHGERNLVGYSPQGPKESDMTKQKQHPPKATPEWLFFFPVLNSYSLIFF